MSPQILRPATPEAAPAPRSLRRENGCPCSLPRSSGGRRPIEHLRPQFPAGLIARGSAKGSLLLGTLVICTILSHGWDARSLTVRHRARALQPGEVVELSVRHSAPMAKVEARVFGKVFPLYSTGDRRVWRGLIGIDLDTRPGSYVVEVEAGTGPDGPVTASYALRIRAKTFPTRRLTVEEKYVTPPPEVEERIRRESERLDAIFSAASASRLWDGAFRPPVDAEPTGSFGKRSILNGRPRSPHSGTDFNAPSGADVRAPAAGKVVLAGELYYSGNTVVLDHGLGLYSLFAHLARTDAAEGEVVKKGALLGRVGSTGRSTGPHLHWSVRLVKARVDPLSLVALTSPAAVQIRRKP